MLDLIGGRTRTRTWDPLIKSQLLYQLSYAPENAARPKEPSPVAKRVPTVQIVGQSFRRVTDLLYYCTAPRLPAYRARAHFTHARRVPQKESRRVGTRRLPYVGDRVGGLGVRPPALGQMIW